VGIETDQARQMKQLQEENSRLKQLVADLSLDKTMLQDVLRKSCEAFGGASAGQSCARSLSGERAGRLPGPSEGARHVSLYSPFRGRAEVAQCMVRRVNAREKF
jgi:hypothetical protein